MNFKAYPPAWAHHDAVRAAAGRWQRRGLLTAAQRAAIEAAHPADYHRPVLFLRIGLFVATLLGVLSMVGAMVAAIDAHISLGSIVACSLIAAVGTGLLLELLIDSSHHYRSGVDNALLYSMLVAWQVVIGSIYMEAVATNPQADSLLSPWLWLALLPVLLSLVVALVRYADPVVAAWTFGVALIGIGMLVSQLLPRDWAVLLLPFALMLAAAGFHVWLRRLPARADYPYYRSSILVLRTLALATIYLTGNLLFVVVQNSTLQDGQQAPMTLAPVFHVFTVGIPLVYLYLGLRRHDRLLLMLGLLASAFSLYTIRYFYSVLPPAIAATMGGAVLIGLVLTALRYLRTPRHGLTAQADDEAAPTFNLEALVVAQTAHVPVAPAGGFEFGGGHSGGGGADGRF
jgi:hypothetical protein